MKENLIRARLGALKMSISEFARQMGMSRPTARRKVDGECQFNIREVEKACAVLKISKEDALLYFFDF